MPLTFSMMSQSTVDRLTVSLPLLLPPTLSERLAEHEGGDRRRSILRLHSTCTPLPRSFVVLLSWTVLANMYTTVTLGNARSVVIGGGRSISRKRQLRRSFAPRKRSTDRGLVREEEEASLADRHKASNIGRWLTSSRCYRWRGWDGRWDGEDAASSLIVSSSSFKYGKVHERTNERTNDGTNE